MEYGTKTQKLKQKKKKRSQGRGERGGEGEDGASMNIGYHSFIFLPRVPNRGAAEFRPNAESEGLTTRNLRHGFEQDCDAGRGRK